jgi:hypothetical protein
MALRVEALAEPPGPSKWVMLSETLSKTLPTPRPGTLPRGDVVLELRRRRGTSMQMPLGAAGPVSSKLADWHAGIQLVHEQFD